LILVRALYGIRIAQIAAGGDRTLALTGIADCQRQSLFLMEQHIDGASVQRALDQGHVYMWGSEEGNDNAHHIQPMVLVALQGVNITQVATGISHSLALSGL
jgi:enoyl-[acyl-carrier-protein] reductase (NADH)